MDFSGFRFSKKTSSEIETSILARNRTLPLLASKTTFPDYSQKRQKWCFTPPLEAHFHPKMRG